MVETIVRSLRFTLTVIIINRCAEIYTFDGQKLLAEYPLVFQ